MSAHYVADQVMLSTRADGNSLSLSHAPPARHRTSSFCSWGRLMLQMMMMQHICRSGSAASQPSSAIGCRGCWRCCDIILHPAPLITCQREALTRSRAAAPRHWRAHVGRGATGADPPTTRPTQSANVHRRSALHHEGDRAHPGRTMWQSDRRQGTQLVKCWELSLSLLRDDFACFNNSVVIKTSSGSAIYEEMNVSCDFHTKQMRTCWMEFSPRAWLLYLGFSVRVQHPGVVCLALPVQKHLRFIFIYFFWGGCCFVKHIGSSVKWLTQLPYRFQVQVWIFFLCGACVFSWLTPAPSSHSNPILDLLLCECKKRNQINKLGCKTF